MAGKTTHKPVTRSDDILFTIESKFNELTEKLRGDMKKELKDLITTALKERDEEIVKLKSTVSMLQEHVNNLKHTQEGRIDELEQYGRRLCLRIDGIPTEENQTSSDVFDVVCKKVKECGAAIPTNNIDRAYRIGKVLESRDGEKSTQSIIVRFTTFRHRTLFYKARKKLKNNVRVKLDLTKRRYAILREAINLVEEKDGVNFVYADINCRLKVRFTNGVERFFDSVEELQSILS